MFFIYGSTDELIQNKLLEITSSSFKHINLWTNTLLQLAEYCNQDKIVSDSEYYIFNLKKLDEKDIALIQSISINPNNIHIIFLYQTNKFDKTLIKSIFKPENIYQAVKLTTPSKRKMVIDYLNLKQIKYTNKDIEIILDLLPNNSAIIKNELTKLNNENFSQYKNILSTYLNYEPFDIIDDFLNNNYSSYINGLNKLFDNENNIMQFYYLFINKITLLLQIKIYKKHNYSYDKINKILKINPFVYKNDYILSDKITLKEIKYILYNLYQIEVESRIYNTDFNLLLKIFLFTKVINEFKS